MSVWETNTVQDSLTRTRVSRKHQIRSKYIAQTGEIPVVDQGKEFIAGYCDDQEKVIDFDLPLVIFGDHTRRFKYVDFPFVLGADGTKILVPKRDLYDPKFFYFALTALEIPSRGYNRHFKTLREQSLPRPPLHEQKKIAFILAAVQRAIETQERIIQIATELKGSLKRKLFTEGLRNEPQKQTEIGLMPDSWDCVSCEEVCEKISVGIVVRPSSYYVPNGVPAFRSQNVREDRIQTNSLVYISREANDGPVSKSKLLAGDVLIVRTGYPGTSCVVPPEFEGSNCIDLIFMRPNDSVLRSDYLSRFFNTDAAKIQVQAGKTGLAQQHLNVSAAQKIQLPLPPVNQQDEIVSILELLDSKRRIAASTRGALKDLFRTLLHNLMTAKIRTNEIALLAGE